MSEGDQKILFVLVHHSDEKVTLDSLQSIMGNRRYRSSITVVVIDNSEVSETKERLVRGWNCSKPPDDIQLRIVTSANIGYFRSANRALLSERSLFDYSYCVISNNDVLFADDFCRALERAEYAESTMVIYPDLVSSTGAHENPRATTFIGAPRLVAYRLYYISYLLARMMGALRDVGASILRRFRRRSRIRASSRGPQEIVLGVGACFVLTPAYFRIVGGLPSEVFLFGEEALLSRNVLLAGGRVLYDGRLKVQHEEHSTVGKMPTRTYWEIQRQSSLSFIPALWLIRRLVRRNAR